MSKPKKSDLIKTFVESLTEDQKYQITTALGRSMTNSTLTTLFTKAFKKTISIASRKGKARNCQKAVCELISAFTGIPWGKDLEIVSREMGQSGVDIRMSERVLKLFPYSVECKNVGNISIKDTILQAQKNLLPDTDWIVFYQQTGQHVEDKLGMVAIVDADHFFELLNLSVKGPVPEVRSKLLLRKPE